MGESLEVCGWVGRRLDEAWRACSMLQRFAGYLAFVLVAIAVLPVVIAGPGILLRPGAWIVVGALALAALLVTGIVRVRRNPGVWAPVLYWSVRPLIWAGVGINPAAVLKRAAGQTDSHREAYDLVRRVPRWLREHPELPEAQRWRGSPRRAATRENPPDPRDEEFPLA